MLVLLDRKREHGSLGFLEYYFLLDCIDHWVVDPFMYYWVFYSMKQTRRIEQFCGTEHQFSYFDK